MRQLGMITIGQAPRTDVAPIIQACVGAEVEIIQVGVLDGLMEQYIITHLQPEPDDHMLTSRMSNGRSVVFSRNKIKPMLQQKIDELEATGIEIILLLCTGTFPDLTTQTAMLIEPDHLLPPLIKALVGQQSIGVIGPLGEQTDSLRAKYHPYGIQPLFATASPYNIDREQFCEAARTLDGQVSLVILDCMGYTREMQAWVQEEVHVPVVLSNAMIGSILSELIG